MRMNLFSAVLYLGIGTTHTLAESPSRPAGTSPAVPATAGSRATSPLLVTT